MAKKKAPEKTPKPPRTKKKAVEKSGHLKGFEPVKIDEIESAIERLEEAKADKAAADEEKKNAEANLAVMMRKHRAKLEKVKGDENELRYVSPEMHVQAFWSYSEEESVKTKKAPAKDD